MIQLLLVDDDEKIYRSVSLFLEKKDMVDPFAFLDDEEEEAPADDVDCKVTWATGGRQGVELLQQHPFDLALIDMNMPPGWDGVQTIEKIREFNPTIPVALVTANITTSDEIQNLLKQHAVRLFHKPYSRDSLVQLVEEMIQS